MKNAVIFDLDGTLANTIPDITDAINKMLQTLGYNTRSKRDILNYINNGVRELVRKALPREVQNVDFILDSAINVYEEEYAKCYCNLTEAYKGIESMLMELKNDGYKIAVLSNKQDVFVKDIVYTLFDRKIFNVVLGQTNLLPKPNPSVGLYLCKLLGEKPSKCIYVGDSDVDVKMAINTGMELISVSWGYRDETVLRKAGALRIANTPEEVIGFVNEISNE